MSSGFAHSRLAPTRFWLYTRFMPKPDDVVDEQIDRRVYPDLPNHVGSDEAFRAAVAAGDADADAGRMTSFADVAKRLYRSRRLA